MNLAHYYGKRLCHCAVHNGQLNMCTSLVLKPMTMVFGLGSKFKVHKIRQNKQLNRNNNAVCSMAFLLCHQNCTHPYTKTCTTILEYSFIHGNTCGISWKWTGLTDKLNLTIQSGGISLDSRHTRSTRSVSFHLPRSPQMLYHPIVIQHGSCFFVLFGIFSYS